MKLKLLLGLLIVVGMIGLGSATEYKETDYGRQLTPEEVDEMYPTWIMPDHVRAEIYKETPESIEKKRLREERLRQNMIKKPLTPEEIAEINANAPEGMFLVSGIEEQLPGKALTPDETMAAFGNASWDYQIPEELRQDSIKRTIVSEKEDKKPLTPEEIAEINANAPEGMFLVSGIEDVSMNRASSRNTGIENARVEGDKIVMNWAISTHSLNSNLTNNSATVFVPNVLEVLRETGIRIGIQVQTTRS
ncbi:hypothetical protein [Methanococcoides sp. NM1]|uniref:hypothetical protein n=1 Tax=Methanococcoides sp. NM1 TaxID=1201013 RepID=UPI00108487BD|nr:hypothetical protein [Methanococcoides sp. NM1]